MKKTEVSPTSKNRPKQSPIAPRAPKELKSGFVVIAGRPNCGKSTLLNRILGSKLSIVSPKAQTTRDRVFGIFTEPGLGQIVFVDTPGIHRAKIGGVNAYMMEQVDDALEGAHLIWVLLDPNSGVQHEQAVIERLQKETRGQETKPDVFLILNKSDLKHIVDQRGRALLDAMELKLGDLGFNVAARLEISALKGKGVDELLKQTWARLPEGPFYYPDSEQVSDRPLKYFVGERIREQLFFHLGEELPYACAISIDNFEEDKKPVRIEATIHVERDSQKGMVIGQGGQKLKEIGTQARHEIEELLDEKKIFLGLRVKVLKDWSKRKETLKQLGYHLTEAK